jgi:DNA-binding FadR family transcriptional regulator
MRCDIKHAILAGELRADQPLVETDLAEVLGVSKTPVRKTLEPEALARWHDWQSAHDEPGLLPP